MTKHVEIDEPGRWIEAAFHVLASVPNLTTQGRTSLEAERAAGRVRVQATIIGPEYIEFLEAQALRESDALELAYRRLMDAKYPAPGRSTSWPSSFAALRERYRPLLGETIVGVVMQAERCVFAVAFLGGECLHWSLTE